METSAVRILVADNFEPWRRFVSSALQRQTGLQVVGEANDGLEAIQKARELNVDLIMLDILFSDLNGLEVAKRISELLPKAKILLATQNSDPHVAKASLSNGAHGYLLKADAGSELLPAIEAVLRGEQFLSRSIKRKSLS
jgi:DNA-binding NarL/FixJ family response regulator